MLPPFMRQINPNIIRMIINISCSSLFVFRSVSLSYFESLVVENENFGAQKSFCFALVTLQLSPRVPLLFYTYERANTHTYR